MTELDYSIEMMVDGPERVVAIKPPVEVIFREQMYERLDELGLIKEIAIREGSYFATQHLADGAAYSALRIPSAALDVAGLSLRRLANMCHDVMEEQGHKAEINRDLLAAGGTRRLFQSLTPNNEA